MINYPYIVWEGNVAGKPCRIVRLQEKPALIVNEKPCLLAEFCDSIDAMDNPVWKTASVYRDTSRGNIRPLGERIFEQAVLDLNEKQLELQG